MPRPDNAQRAPEAPILGTDWQWHINPRNKVVQFSRQDIWDKGKKYKIGVTGVCSVGPGYLSICFGSSLTPKEEAKWMMSDVFGEFVQLMFAETAKPLVEIDVERVLEVLNPFPCDEKRRRLEQRQQQIAASLTKRS